MIAGTACAQPTPALTREATLDHQATGVAVTADGRRFVNFPRWTDDAPVSVAEVTPGGTLRPYPDARWNEWRNARVNELSVADHFVCVQSIVPDGRGRHCQPKCTEVGFASARLRFGGSSRRMSRQSKRQGGDRAISDSCSDVNER